MKKALAIIFCTGNTNKSPNTDKNIINANNYLDKKNLVQKENLIDQENSNIKPVNFNTRESLKDRFAEAYEKNKLV